MSMKDEPIDQEYLAKLLSVTYELGKAADEALVGVLNSLEEAENEECQTEE